LQNGSVILKHCGFLINSLLFAVMVICNTYSYISQKYFIHLFAKHLTANGKQIPGKPISLMNRLNLNDPLHETSENQTSNGGGIFVQKNYFSIMIADKKSLNKFANLT
jgi:hypothetical protein